MRAELVLAVDVGSTWCKAAYLNCHGQLVADGRAYTRDIPLDRNTTLPRFWSALQAAVRMATAKVPIPCVPAAIGISTRALFGVCQNVAGEWSLPAWDAQLDRRTSPAMQWAYSAAVWGDQDPFAYGYGVWVGGLMHWLQQTRPAEWHAIHRIGALHDYILYQLTETWITDPTTGPGERGWPTEIVAMSGLPRSAFPQVQPAHQIAGGLTPAASQALDLPAGLPVVVGMHDGAAANLGVGAVQPGDACLTLGSNLVLRVVADPPPLTQAMRYLIVPGRDAWVGNVPGASTQLDLTAATLRPQHADVAAAHRELGELAAAALPDAAALVLHLHPPDAETKMRQAVTMARQAGHSDAAIYRATVEAVAVGIQALVQRAIQHGAQPRRFVTTGGHSQNELFLRMLATLLAEPLAIGPIEGGVLGAGIAAAIGAGWYGDFDAAVREMVVGHRRLR